MLNAENGITQREKCKMAIKLNDSYGKTQIMKNEKILKEKELISQRNAEIRAI